MILSLLQLINTSKRPFFPLLFFLSYGERENLPWFQFSAIGYDHTTRVSVGHSSQVPGSCLFWLNSPDRENLADFRLGSDTNFFKGITLSLFLERTVNSLDLSETCLKKKVHSKNFEKKVPF